MLPLLLLLEVVRRVRGVGEVGARALAAVADRAAEAVDRVRAVGVEVEARPVTTLPLGVDRRRAVGQVGVGARRPSGIGLPSASLS